MNIFGIDVILKWLRPPDPNAPVVPFQFVGKKLGRPLAPVHDPRTLRFAEYVTDDGLVAPPVCNYGDKVKNWLMLLNDVLGICTIAGVLHASMLWLSQNGFSFQPTDADAKNLYIKYCRYVDGDAKTDNGGIEIDILKAWRQSPIMGVGIVAFASVDPKNWEHVKLAHYLAGTLYMGIALPLSAQKPGLWSDLSDAPGGWGGHCTISCGYTDKPGLLKRLLGGICKRLSSARLTIVTWGTTQDLTPEWLAKYCDELWMPISPAWFNKLGVAPNGINMTKLLADAARCSTLSR